MSQDKIESRRVFLKNLSKAAGAAAFAVPLMAGDLCFSKEEIDKFENDLDNIQVKDSQSAEDNPQTRNCECYGACGGNFHMVLDCTCYGGCGSNFHRINRCDCYGGCGGNYSQT